MRVRDWLAALLMFAGIGGIFMGVRGASVDHWWGGPCIGTGLVANLVAYQAMKPARAEVTRRAKKDEDDSA